MNEPTLSRELTPTKLDKHSSTEMFLGWSNGEQFAVPFSEMRFHCPCAGCVDEHTGQRTLKRENVRPDIRIVKVELIGRYAVHVMFNDGHGTGIYHFDRLYELCQKTGLKLA